jgi:alkylhydroperoxidase/carboxymuconolactone decarboxylase family protein YurZ
MEMKISKTDAAQRQLDTAIELYFAESDPVAIHTLAAAAYELIRALREREGLPDEITDAIIPGREAEFRQLWNEAQNFFKHADRDGDAVLEFDPAHTGLRLYVASHYFGALAPRTEAMLAFAVWYSMHNVELLLDPELQVVLRMARTKWEGMTRVEFRELIREGAKDVLG